MYFPIKTSFISPESYNTVSCYNAICNPWLSGKLRSKLLFSYLIDIVNIRYNQTEPMFSSNVIADWSDWLIDMKM